MRMHAWILTAREVAIPSPSSRPWGSVAGSRVSRWSAPRVRPGHPRPCVLCFCPGRRWRGAVTILEPKAPPEASGFSPAVRPAGAGGGRRPEPDAEPTRSRRVSGALMVGELNSAVVDSRSTSTVRPHRWSGDIDSRRTSVVGPHRRSVHRGRH
jgi:hypothetical protein